MEEQTRPKGKVASSTLARGTRNLVATLFADKFLACKRRMPDERRVRRRARELYGFCERSELEAVKTRGRLLLGAPGIMNNTIKISENKQFKIAASLNNQEVGELIYKIPKDDAGGRNLEINWLKVDKSHRRRHIATQLLNFFINKAAKKGVIWISFWTGREMEENQTYGLYKKLGFKQVFTQDDYYAPGIPTRLFVKRLN